MKHIGKLMGLFGLGALLVAFNLGGIAGCGSSSTSSGGGVTNSNVTSSLLLNSVRGIAQYAETSSSAALVASSCTGDPSTGLTCDCDGGGSSTFTFGASTTDTLEFNNCVDADGNTLNGTVSINTNTTTSTSTVTYTDFSDDLATCGLFTLNGTVVIVDNGDGTSSLTLALTAKSGSDTIKLNGDLTDNADSTLSGTLDYSGPFTLSCTFNHDDLSDCNNFASACGIAASDVCSGTAYDTTLCQ